MDKETFDMFKSVAGAMIAIKVDQARMLKTIGDITAILEVVAEKLTDNPLTSSRHNKE